MPRWMLASVALLLPVMACSPIVSKPQTTPEQQALSGTVCADVMNIWTGDVYYARCREAIVDVLADQMKRQAMLSAYKTCSQSEADESSAKFAACMQSEASKSPSQAHLTVVASQDPDTEPGIRFDNISLPVQLNRERYACAQLGLFPGGGPFESCVAGLQDALIANKY